MDEYSSASSNELRFFLLGFVALLVFMVVVSRAFPSATPSPQQMQQQDYHGEQPNYMTKPQEAQKRMEMLAQQTQGDYNKLSYEDMKWLDSMTSGHGLQALESHAKALKAKEQKEKQTKAK